MFGLPAVPNTAVPVPDPSSPPKNAVRKRVVVHHHVAVLHRELRERGLLRRTEGAELLDRRQRLLDQRVGGAHARVGLRHTGDLRQRGVDLIEGAQADVGLGGRSAGGRRRTGTGGSDRSAVVADAIEGQEEQVVEHALSSAMTVPTDDMLLAGAGGVARADRRGPAARRPGRRALRAPFTPMRMPSIGRFGIDVAVGSRLMKVGLVNCRP